MEVFGTVTSVQDASILDAVMEGADVVDKWFNN